jgi:predicted site-specific integrase-resolvase
MTRTVVQTDEAAQILGIAAGTLRKWRVYGTGPRFMKMGKAVRYRLTDLEEYQQASLKENTSREV